ncbi:MAG: acyl carrier protein [Rhizobiaceae bacterium]
MTPISVQPLRDLLADKLAQRGDTRPLGDDDSLFLSGRLDSLAATEAMLLLESAYAVDLADADFDVTRMDTINELKAFLASRGHA